MVAWPFVGAAVVVEQKAVAVDRVTVGVVVVMRVQVDSPVL